MNSVTIAAFILGIVIGAVLTRIFLARDGNSNYHSRPDTGYRCPGTVKITTEDDDTTIMYEDEQKAPESVPYHYYTWGSYCATKWMQVKSNSSYVTVKITNNKDHEIYVKFYNSSNPGIIEKNSLNDFNVKNKEWFYVWSK